MLQKGYVDMRTEPENIKSESETTTTNAGDVLESKTMTIST